MDNQNQNTPAVPDEAMRKEDLILDISAQPERKKEEQTKKPKTLQSLFDDLNNYIIEEMSAVSVKEKLLFFQLLGSMLGAGVSLTDSLHLLAKETENPKLARVIEDMKVFVEGGGSFAQAMKNNDDVFDTATCAVVAAGEKSGKMNEILKELVNQYDRLDQLKEKVKSVMTYPVIVIVTMIVLAIVVVVFVVPKIKVIFGGAENLPLPTRILLTTSDIVRAHWLLLIIVVATLIGLFISWQRSPEGKKQWGSILLSIPGISTIIRDMIIVRVTKIFGFLISAGVPMIDSLKIAADIAGNQNYKEKLLLAADDLGRGIMIAENISDDPKLFPKMLVHMMAIGEKTASLDKTMVRVSQFYDDLLDRRIKALSEIMEPVILAFIAAGAVFMILAIYLPILRMNDAIMGS